LHKLKPKQASSNVNVTLDSSVDSLESLRGLEFPCPFCSAGLPLGLTIANKPYCTCNSCGVQIFVRGKKGIKRLQEMVDEGILISDSNESVSHGISLLNRLEQLKKQRSDLESKRGFFLPDENVENAIRIVDAEKEKVEGELARIAKETESENK
jgi:DNA-directed RNA polymerase subunit RPC12/RpoP